MQEHFGCALSPGHVLIPVVYASNENGGVEAVNLHVIHSKLGEHIRKILILKVFIFFLVYTICSQRPWISKGVS